MAGLCRDDDCQEAAAKRSNQTKFQRHTDVAHEFYTQLQLLSAAAVANADCCSAAAAPDPAVGAARIK